MGCCHERKVVVAEKAPKPIGPYSVAIQAGQFVFVSGQIGLDPATGQIVDGGVEAETRQALTNLKNALKAAQLELENVVRTTVFLREMKDFERMNAVYAEFFTDEPPARSTIQVAGLPRGGAVEIDVIALSPHHECQCCTE